MTIQDPQQFLVNIARLLERLGIAYAITGGMSVVVWGRPRFTADIDVVVNPTNDQVEQLISAFHEFGEGVYVDDDMIREAYRTRGECNIIDSASGVKVDIWFGSGENVRKQLERRVSKRIDGDDVYFLSPEDLIVSKLTWFQKSQSTRHLEDIESVLAVSGSLVNTEYVDRQSQGLGFYELWRSVSEKVLPKRVLFSYEYAVLAEQGTRPSMEDFSCVIDEQNDRKQLYCGVYDGHGGTEASRIACNHISKTFFLHFDQRVEPFEAFSRAYESVDREMEDPLAGSCALDVLIPQSGFFWFAYAGDSRLLVVDNNNVMRVTADHRITNRFERERIEQAGGTIQHNRVVKEGYSVEVTRALGDHFFRDAGVIAAPQTGTYQLQETDQWLVLATDGFFEIFSDNEVVGKLREYTNCQEALLDIQKTLLQKKAADNVTIILIRIEHE